MNESDFLSLAEAAVYLKIKPKTLRSWILKKKGPSFYKVGHFVRYKIEDLDAFIAASRVENSVAVAPVTVSCWPIDNVRCSITKNPKTKFSPGDPVYFGETLEEGSSISPEAWEKLKSMKSNLPKGSSAPSKYHNGEIYEGIVNPPSTIAEKAESMVMEIKEEVEDIENAGLAVALHQAKLKGLIKEE